MKLRVEVFVLDALKANASDPCMAGENQGRERREHDEWDCTEDCKAEGAMVPSGRRDRRSNRGPSLWSIGRNRMSERCRMTTVVRDDAGLRAAAAAVSKRHFNGMLSS